VIRVSLVLVALAPLLASGAEWPATFVPDRLATHLLADEYNQRLERGDVHAGLTLLPGGAGLALAGSF
jgi:hypothetical protein